MKSSSTYNDVIANENVLLSPHQQSPGNSEEQIGTSECLYLLGSSS